MHCPNCGREAINVNGKFVCLDCGVELNPTQASSTPTDPSSANGIGTTSDPVSHSISKYNGSGPLDQDQAKTSPLPPESTEPTPMVATDANPDLPTPVKDEYVNDLADKTREATGSYDFTAKPEPTAPQVAPTVEAAKPENYFQPESIDITPQTSTVPAPKDSFDTLSTPSGETNTEPLVNQLSEQNEAPVEAKELFIEEPEPVVAPPTNAESITPQVPITLEVPVSVATPEPETPKANLDDLLNTYSAPNTPNSAPVTMPPTPNPAFDSLRATESPMPNLEPQNPYQKDTIPSGMPGASNIPSAESVFGPQSTTNPEQLDVSGGATNNRKKLIIIIACALVGILVLGGLIWLGVVLTKPKNVATTEQKTQEETLRISEEISEVMDGPQNVLAQFEQTMDFTAATVKVDENDPTSVTGAADIKKLFEKPIIASGTWQTNEGGDIALDATLNDVASKIIYIVADKSSYIFSNTQSIWSRVEGDQVAGVPPFYPPRPKGVIFYNTKVNSITELSKEELDGGLYRKMKIVSKVDIVEEAIRTSNIALANIKFDSLNIDNLEVIAWVTDDGQIYKIALVGDVGVESDLFSGTVNINSVVKYQYINVTIEKPTIPAS